ncbi:DUF7852 domain-containing protein [Clostridium tagluense]|uniref:DUF7852 domain-containing protein n=1 Tax=Clostridium tagluense TaxID=360422 RepID=A0A401UMK0_9CLOT|nr:hypothetical protein [Clostridium tagluense]GCD10760.1 hypothetical protein Ctaglu_23830 [Clostridium tagluense]
MIQYNNCDKLNILKLIIIINILQQSYYSENINKISKKNSPNIKLKNNIDLNNSSVKRDAKDIMDLDRIFPIQEKNIEDDTKCIKDKIKINTNNNNNNNTTADTPDNDIYEITENINTNHNENFILTVPIIISKINIDIPIELTFKLKNATLDVKNIKNEIYLTNSKVLPMY